MSPARAALTALLTSLAEQLKATTVLRLCACDTWPSSMLTSTVAIAVARNPKTLCKRSWRRIVNGNRERDTIISPHSSCHLWICRGRVHDVVQTIRLGSRSANCFGLCDLVVQSRAHHTRKLQRDQQKRN